MPDPSVTSTALVTALSTLEWLVVGIGLLFLLSGLDDLFIDLVYLVRTLYRRNVIEPRHLVMQGKPLNLP